MTMETVYLDVTAALNNWLLEFRAGSMTDRIFFPNTKFNPPTGQEFLRCVLLFNAPTMIGAFTTGTYRINGIYQINVFYPKGEGEGVPVQTAGDLCKRFQRGLELTHGNHTVKIERSYRSSALEDDVWYQIPVTADFWCYSQYSE